jgi:hypothetical protein
MGNGCFYGNTNHIPDVNLDKDKTKDIENQTPPKDKNRLNNPLNTEGEENTKSKMSQIIGYFNEGEAEFTKEYNRLKEKNKNKIKKNNNEKYELILQRLLEQKNVKIIGPKRRETIRKEGDKIQNMVQELLKENKDDILKGKKNETSGTLIIKHPLQKKGNTSMTIDKNPLIPNSRRKTQNFFKKRNTLNEMINKAELHDFQKIKTINCQADC